MKNFRRIVVRLAMWVAASGCLCSSLYAMQIIDFQRMELRGVPQFSDPVYAAIRTREEWLTFTKPRDPPPTPRVPGQILTPIPQPPVSEVDFDKFTLLFIGIGGRTGWSLSVQEIFTMGDELWVQYIVLRPGKDCAVAQIIGHPYITVLIPRTSKPVRFNETNADIDCNNRKSSSEMTQLLEAK